MQVPLAPFFFGAGLLLRSRALLGPWIQAGCRNCSASWESWNWTGQRAGTGCPGPGSGSDGIWLPGPGICWPSRPAQDGDPGPGTKEERRLGSGAVPGTGLAGTDPPGFFPGPGRRSGPVAPGGLCQTGADRFLRAVDPEPDLMEFRNLLLPGLSRKEQAEAASWEILQQIEYPPGTFALGVEAGPETGEDILLPPSPWLFWKLEKPLPGKWTGSCSARKQRRQPGDAGWSREPARFSPGPGPGPDPGAWYGYGRLLALRNLPLADGEEAMPEETAGLLWDKLPAGIRERFQTGPTGLYLAGGTEEEQQAWKEFFQQQWDCPVRLLEGKAQFQWAPYYTEKQPSGLTSGLCGALGAVLSEGRPSAFCFASGGERGRWLSGISWLDLGKKMAAGSWHSFCGAWGPGSCACGKKPAAGNISGRRLVGKASGRSSRRGGSSWSGRKRKPGNG